MVGGFFLCYRGENRGMNDHHILWVQFGDKKAKKPETKEFQAFQ